MPGTQTHIASSPCHFNYSETLSRIALLVAPPTKIFDPSVITKKYCEGTNAIPYL